MTRNQNHDDDASSRKKFKTCDKDGVAPWSDLNHDVLCLVMMQLGAVDFLSFSGVCKSWRSFALCNRRKRFKTFDNDDWSDLNNDVLCLVMLQPGVVDFLAFSGVCKSWRSFALCNRMRFMGSRKPMKMWISNGAYKKGCYLEDFEGRKFKTLLPHSVGSKYVGLTCGYLVFFMRETKDFWLVNPITRHELHFPDFPFYVDVDRDPLRIKAILVFSPSISGWVFIIFNEFTYNIWFSIADKGAWNHVSTAFPITDIHAFKGKIYTLNMGFRVYEMRLNPELKLTLLEFKNIWKPHFIFPEFVSSRENLYVMDRCSVDLYKVLELDFDKMKWVISEKTIEEYAFFHSNLNDSVAIKPWRSQYKRYAFFSDDKSRKCRLFDANMWYFPHECMNANLMDE